MEDFLNSLPIDKARSAIYYAIRTLRHLKGIWPDNVNSESSIEEKDLGIAIVNEIIKKEKRLLSEFDKITIEKYIIELSNYLEKRNKEITKSAPNDKSVDLEKWRNEFVHNYDKREYSRFLNQKIFISYTYDSNIKNDIQELFLKLDLSFLFFEEGFPRGTDFFSQFIQDSSLIDFAIFILTKTSASHIRNNQLFELGYLLGKLGRDKVILLTEPETIIPSDLAGLRTLFTYSDYWKFDLIRELDFAGIKFDKNKLTDLK